MDRFVCIHGHFYQPPRESPWLESIELQASAAPYHDWNQRITAECYAPNARSPILDERGQVAWIVNNYSRISFNFGPTLLGWLELHAPATYGAILEADAESRTRFSGHGSAMAQAYNHAILPLGDRRDKRTQVVWGIRDFELRFGRRPEGLWLPETAVDLETLEVLAAEGLAFTLLAPSQAARVRPAAGRGGRSGAWRDVQGGGVLDTTMPYRAELPSGASIALFFYDASVSHAVAFERLLSSGREFARRLAGAFGDETKRPRLVHIATDGETYGHHHRHGDMALAHALQILESSRGLRLTNYGEYLALHPPTQRVEVVEQSSWSCAHGVLRWRSDCGCRLDTGKPPRQAWRAPLREALDGLRDSLNPRYDRAAVELFHDPLAARDGYVDCIVLHRSGEIVEAFLARHLRSSTEGSRQRALELLELQRQTQLMFTSCGWFFDDLSGIETLQILQYASRAIELAERLFGIDLEPEFLDRLDRAPGGRSLYEEQVRPARVDLARVAANHAAERLFHDPGRNRFDAGYRIDGPAPEYREAGQARLLHGRLGVASRITRESADLEFALVHLGGRDLTGGVRPYAGPEPYARAATDLEQALRAGGPAVPEALARHYPRPLYALSSLFIDVRRAILDQLNQASG